MPSAQSIKILKSAIRFNPRAEFEIPDWEEMAVRRLSFLCSVATIAGVLAAILSLAIQPNSEGIRAGTTRPLILLPLFMIASGLTWWFSRRAQVSYQRRLDVGLVYLVLSCFAVSLFRHWLPYATSDVIRGVSPIIIAVLFFSVIVPVQPLRMGIAAIAATTVDAFGLLVTTWFGQPVPPWNIWFWLLTPNLVAIVLSVICSRFLFTLGQSVERARDLGSYRLIERLGVGGMGEVWSAEHHTLARPAAVKLVKRQGINAHNPDEADKTLRRFEREAQATAGLTSHHTIEVYDFGVADDGTFYYVMELLDGLDLESMIATHGALSPAHTIYLLRQVCHSLSDAHSAGVIHRDIKPANIFICRKGRDRDFVKVLDFGLVKFRRDEEEDIDETKLTKEGSILGSPAYMPPEMAQKFDVGPHADIYAFGCVAFWILTARTVFTGKGVLQQLISHVQDRPESPSTLSPFDVPPEFEALIMQCLEKSPDDRPESFTEIDERLADLTTSLPWSSYDSRRWWKAKNQNPDDARVIDALQDTLHAPSGSTALRDTLQAPSLDTTELSGDTAIALDETLSS